MSAESESTRPDRILDAAEQAFANSGFAGASMRQIVTEAKVNLATVYYHFGSKEGLMQAVLERRFGPLQKEQQDWLRQAERRAKGRPIPIEKVLKGMLLPPLCLAAVDSAHTPVVMRLLGRIVTEPNPQIQALLHQKHKAVRDAYLSAIQRSLPDLPAAELRWRFEFIWGALAFVLCNPAKIEGMTGGMGDPTDTETVLAHMVRFFSAGLRAPARTPSAPPPGNPKRPVPLRT